MNRWFKIVPHKDGTRLELDQAVLKQTTVDTKKVKTDLLKKTFLDWSHETRIDSYSKIFEYKNIFGRLFWAICLLTLSVLTMLLLIQIVLDYYQYDVVTQIDTITERPIIFPTITVCNINPFTSIYSQKILLNVSINNYGQDIDNVNVTYDQVMEYLPNITELTKMYVSQKNFSQENKINLGNSIGQYLSVKFGGNLIKQSLNWYFSYDYGNCIQFNSESINSSKKQMSYREGKEYGLTLLYPFLSTDSGVIYPTSISDGLMVFIHESSFDPISSDGVSLSFYRETNLAIKKTIKNKSPLPYSDCADLTSFKSELYDFIINSKKKYRQYDCFNLCRQKLIIQNCGCYYAKYPILYDSAPCLNLTQWVCISRPENDLNSINQIECSKVCPLECDSIAYDIQMSTASYPTDQLWSLWNYKSLNKINIESNIASYPSSSLAFNIYFPYLEYTQITESPKTSWFDLISQIGGSIGIFLGLSVFHFLEIFEILFLIFYVLLKN